MQKVKVIAVAIGALLLLTAPLPAHSYSHEVRNAYHADKADYYSSMYLMYGILKSSSWYKWRAKVWAKANYSHARASYQSAKASHKRYAFKMYYHAYKQYYYAALNYSYPGRYVNSQAKYDYYNDRWTGYLLTKNSLYHNKEVAYAYYADTYDARSSYYLAAGALTRKSTHRWKSYSYALKNVRYAKASYLSAKASHKWIAQKMYYYAYKQYYYAALNYNNLGKSVTTQMIYDRTNDRWNGYLLTRNTVTY